MEVAIQEFDRSNWLSAGELGKTLFLLAMNDLKYQLLTLDQPVSG